MQLENNNIVQLKNGKRGIVSSIMGKPWLVVFGGFTMTINRFDDKLNAKNDQYSIEKVWDGSGKEDYPINKVWAKSFDENEFKLIYDRNA